MINNKLLLTVKRKLNFDAICHRIYYPLNFIL